MLIEFRVENHRSLREEQTFTLAASSLGEAGDSRPRIVEGHNEPLLPVAVFYGANASGKSNLLAALCFMREAVVYSQIAWLPDNGVPRDPFAWGERANAPSLYELTCIVQGIRYQYGFVVSDDRIEEEWLFAWPHGIKQMWFERELDKYQIHPDLAGENELIVGLTRPNALFLSSAAQNRQEQLAPLYRWFFNFRFEGVLGSQRSMPEGSQLFLVPQMFGSSFPWDEVSNSPILAGLRELFQSSDVGIVDFKIVTEPFGFSIANHKRPKGTRVFFKHQAGTEDSWLPLEEESKGTQTLFRIAEPIFATISRGGTLVVDELEASLHPLVALQVVRHFNDPLMNPKNAQLLFTTHDTNLLGTTLGEPALRRDQVWFTEKDEEGATKVYPLTDYIPRHSENLERGYLQGRYGAIPFLGNFNVLPE